MTTETKQPHGGKREGAGRKVSPHPAVGRIAFRCSPELAEKALALAGESGDSLSKLARKIFESSVRQRWAARSR